MTIDDFWQWMSENSEELLEADGQIVADRVHERLHDVDERLGVEVSEPAEPREMIITAWSEAGAFPAVRELVAAAPALDGWQIIALKPPRGFEFGIDVDGLRIDANELQFDPLSAEENRALLGIRVYVPSATDEDEADDRLARILPLILETGIGEEAAAQIDHTDFVAGPATDARALPIDQLLRYVQWHRKKHGLD
jgi:hypothetical protein